MKKGKKIKFTEEEWAELNNTPSYEEWKKLFNDIQGLFVKKDPTVTDLNTPTNVVEPQKPLGTKKTNVLINTTNEPINKTTNKIMTPKAQTEELVDKFIPLFDMAKRYWAKESVLIVVDEIIEQLNHLPTNGYGMEYQDVIQYWQQVKREIEKL
jgi:hypothetical protein